MFVIVGSNSKLDNTQMSPIIPPSFLIARCKFAFATFQFRQIEFISNSYLEAKQTALRQFWMWWWHWMRGGMAQIFSWPRIRWCSVNGDVSGFVARDMDGVVYRAPFSVFLKNKKAMNIQYTYIAFEIRVWEHKCVRKSYWFRAPCGWFVIRNRKQMGEIWLVKRARFQSKGISHYSKSIFLFLRFDMLVMVHQRMFTPFDRIYDLLIENEIKLKWTEKDATKIALSELHLKANRAEPKCVPSIFQFVDDFSRSKNFFGR